MTWIQRSYARTKVVEKGWIVHEIGFTAQPIDRFQPLISEAEFRDYLRLANLARKRWEDRTLWNFSSTAIGGGVAEMLRAILPYARGIGLDMRWVVLEGSPEFFRITKRLHHALHGSAGDGSALGPSERRVYDSVLNAELDRFEVGPSPGDLVLLHDPQSAGLIGRLVKAGAGAIWRCHVGRDVQNDETEKAWAFLEPYVSRAQATVFSRRSFIPSCCQKRATIIHPSIDPFSPKCQPLSTDVVEGILDTAGLVLHARRPAGPHFVRSNGSPGRVIRQARLVTTGGPPNVDEPLVVQVSRWDPLKDPVGVMHGFVRMLESYPGISAHLMLAGPDPDSVADDPEGLATYEATVQARAALPKRWLPRIHLAALPMDDPEENAAIVNALQRHAAVIVQKSLAEGFGLTVTEAMAKGRPVLASGVGGILEQVEDGVHGRLLKDPNDPSEFATVLASLLLNPALGDQLGKAAEKRALCEFSSIRTLRDYETLFARVDDEVAQAVAN